MQTPPVPSASTLVATSVPLADERAAGASIAGKRERLVSRFFTHGPYLMLG